MLNLVRNISYDKSLGVYHVGFYSFFIRLYDGCVRVPFIIGIAIL